MQIRNYLPFVQKPLKIAICTILTGFDHFYCPVLKSREELLKQEILCNTIVHTSLLLCCACQCGSPYLDLDLEGLLLADLLLLLLRLGDLDRLLLLDLLRLLERLLDLL